MRDIVYGVKRSLSHPAHPSASPTCSTCRTGLQASPLASRVTGGGRGSTAELFGGGAPAVALSISKLETWSFPTVLKTRRLSARPSRRNSNRRARTRTSACRRRPSARGSRPSKPSPLSCTCASMRTCQPIFGSAPRNFLSKNFATSPSELQPRLRRRRARDARRVFGHHPSLDRWPVAARVSRRPPLAAVRPLAIGVGRHDSASLEDTTLVQLTLEKMLREEAGCVRRE